MLHFVEGTMNSEKYIETMEEVMFLLVYGLLSDNFIFQQDNAPCHCTRMTNAWFQITEIEAIGLASSQLWLESDRKIVRLDGSPIGKKKCLPGRMVKVNLLCNFSKIPKICNIIAKKRALLNHLSSMRSYKCDVHRFALYTGVPSIFFSEAFKPGLKNDPSVY